MSLFSNHQEGHKHLSRCVSLFGWSFLLAWCYHGLDLARCVLSKEERSFASRRELCWRHTGQPGASAQQIVGERLAAAGLQLQ